MTLITTSAASASPPAPTSPIQFYSIELTPPFGGGLAVGVMATWCEDGRNPESIDLRSHRIASLNEAPVVIRGAIARN